MPLPVPVKSAWRREGRIDCRSADFGWNDAIVAAVLEGGGLLAVEASLKAVGHCRDELSQKRKALELALENAKFVANRSSRQYDATDPENQRVAAGLESRWNTTLVHISELESRLLEHPMEEPVSDPSQKERLFEVGSYLQALWDELTMPVELKKLVLRTVINKLVVGVDRDSGHIELFTGMGSAIDDALLCRSFLPSVLLSGSPCPIHLEGFQVDHQDLREEDGRRPRLSQ